MLTPGMYVTRVYTRIYLLSGRILSYTCMLFATYHLYRVKHYCYCSRYANLFTAKYRNLYFRDMNPNDIKTKLYMYIYGFVFNLFIDKEQVRNAFFQYLFLKFDKFSELLKDEICKFLGRNDENGIIDINAAHTVVFCPYSGEY